MNFKDLLRNYQQKIALAVGFVAVAGIGFWGGVNMSQKLEPKPLVSASSSNTNYTQETPAVQTPETAAMNSATQALAPLNCSGKIKGSSTHKYHMPGGAFYNKTTKPIACFDTEAEAKAAGFIKSAR
jgi:hypothetical protein